MAGSRATEPRTVLEHLLHQQDRTYEETAYDFQKLARDLGERGVSISGRHLRRLASGERTGTTPATRRVLQAMFNRGIDELLQPIPSEQHIDTGRRPIGAVATFPQNELLNLATERARKFALLTRTSSMSADMMDQIIDDVRELARSLPQRPVTELLGKLIETQDILFTLLEVRHKPTLARQLYFFSGVVSGLLAIAILCLDFSDSRRAQSQARAAFLCADHADHDGLRAWIRALQSMFAYWSGRPHESIKYAQSGAQFAATAKNTTTVRLSATEARAWAQLGNASRTRAAIEQAERARDHVRFDDLDELGGFCLFDRPWQLYYTSDSLAWLPGESATASQYSMQAITAYQDTSVPRWWAFQALSRVNLALSRLDCGEIDGAREILAPVFALPPDKRLDPIVYSMQRVHTSITRSTLISRVQDLQEHIEMFSSASLSAPLR